MTEPASGLVTLLFTDLVDSTELLSRTGDEEAQRIFSAHHELLAEAVAEHGGHEVKWLGDGLMVAFPSAADALSCAITMQQAAQRPMGGERLSIRVCLTAGEALRDVADYFGTPVVMAKRLCDRAAAGQILCSDLVAGLLSGRPGFTFAAVGELELKGLPQPVAAYEVRYQLLSADPMAGATPLVGREAELARLTHRLQEAAGGRGGLVLMAGEPGIGKTRLAEEVAARAERAGNFVLWGRCFEGEWAPPYAPFAEALAPHVAVAVPEELRVDLGPGATALAQLVPRIRDVLPDLPEPAPVPPEEERFRLLDAMAQFLVARSRRAPVVLVLDDLQWADRSTVAMLRHLVRSAPRERVLLVGAYPDIGLDPEHPLSDLLGVVAREAGYEHIDLKGLDRPDVTRLLGLRAGHDVDEKVGAAWMRQTEGNPFFIEELLRHLIEEGSLYQGPDGRWTTTKPLADLGVPHRVREVVARRLARLSKPAHQLLQAAAAFDGSFRFDVVQTMAGLSELEALDALDEVLAIRLLTPAGGPETYIFLRTLIRQTVYQEFSPSRQVRLHRRAAEALDAALGANATPDECGEIAVQYHRSRTLPEADRGVTPALIAADQAQTTGGYDEAAILLRMALDMLPSGDERQPRLLGRLAIVSAWALDFEEAARVAAEAGDAIAEAEGKAAAADYLADAAYVVALAGGIVQSWDLARLGLTYAGTRDISWARLISFDYERRAAEDPDYPGIAHDSPERRESARIVRAAGLDPLGPAPMEAVFDSRAEALESSNLIVLALWAGEYARCLPLFDAEAEEAEAVGRFARAARAWAMAAICRVALGRIAEARGNVERAEGLANRLGTPIFVVLNARETLSQALDDGWDILAGIAGGLAGSTNPALAWGIGLVTAFAARAEAGRGGAKEAVAYLGALVPWLEHAPAWTLAFPRIACLAAEVLWILDRRDHAGVIERALREKVVAPDFRYAMVDGRLALAQLCALTDRADEALEWFGEARDVLAVQGARPLLAICDHDEALMYARRGAPGDSERARSLLAAARHRFIDLGMTGWVGRADELTVRLG
jgi:class 3 adenylate cyclase/tetratricopeptide (TPR) repeat protein